MSNYDYFEGIYRTQTHETGWNSTEGDLEVLAYLHELLGAAGVAPPARLVELGCGMGNLSFALADEGYQVCGIDISLSAIDEAVRRGSTRAAATPSFCVGDLSRQEAYTSLVGLECVVDSLFLHCIVGDDRSHVLSWIRKTLEPGGCFIVMTMYGDPRSTELQSRFSDETRCVVSQGIVHRYLGRLEAIVGELTRAGFAITYQRLQAGDDRTGDQDMLLAVCRVP